MKSRYTIAALLIVLGCFTAAAQTTIFDENFDGGYTGSFGTGSYYGGSPANTNISVLASGGNPNGCLQMTMKSTTSGDSYTAQVQLMSVSGNTDPNPANYVIAFDAKGNRAANIQFTIQTWPNDYFGGTGPVIGATVSDPLSAANTWQTFATNLGSITTASPTGATWTALAERTTTSPAAPTVTPRLANNSRSRSTARVTRFCAASSLMPRMPAISGADFFSK